MENFQVHTTLGEAVLQQLGAPLVLRHLLPVLVLPLLVAMHKGREVFPKPDHLRVLRALLRGEAAGQHHVLTRGHSDGAGGSRHVERSWEKPPEEEGEITVGLLWRPSSENKQVLLHAVCVLLCHAIALAA